MRALTQKELIGALIVECSAIMLESGAENQLDGFLAQNPGVADRIAQIIEFARPAQDGGTFEPCDCLEIIQAAIFTFDELEKEENK